MDTGTSYLGLHLEHPFVAGASPLGASLDSVKRLEDAGVAAVVLPSLFEEQITQTQSGRIAHMSVHSEEFAKQLSVFPAPAAYAFGPDEYAELVHRVTQATAVPVIASLNGRTAESWLKFALMIERAGAHALELNIYDIHADLSATSVAIEERVVGVVHEVKRILTIPVAVKLPPFFTAFGNLARRLDQAGADGLALFNRFYQPDIDIGTMALVPRVDLSTSAELSLRLHWIAILHGRVRPSLALCGGVATPEDGIKAVLAGADVVQLVSALLHHGPGHLAVMRRGLEQWLESRQFVRLDEARGAASLADVADPGLFERAQYIRTLNSWPTR